MAKDNRDRAEIIYENIRAKHPKWTRQRAWACTRSIIRQQDAKRAAKLAAKAEA